MEPKHRYSLWEKFCKVKPSHLIDRILIKCVMFFFDLGLALYGDGCREDLSSAYIHRVNNPNLIN
ncbi:hypothetical protein [Chamaesiphon sp. VAR_48_metabat_403]|uniref:hypothetical protein n=1 Tax=Chamaesiphon sp. VAR_48_metabat_403 TaxID=2964700 RepID=UPI00286E4362|nr:hypothetical protein [Chamaesiphon sp. VAR_48_metabat_403]